MTMPEIARVAQDAASVRVPMPEGDGPIHAEIARLHQAHIALSERLAQHAERLMPVLPPDDAHAPVAGRIREGGKAQPSAVRNQIQVAADEAERLGDWIAALTEMLEV